LYRNGSGPRTQYLVAQSEALTRLGTPASITDPSLQIPRNALRAPALKFYDVSVAKRFAFSESGSVSFEANFFNVFNRTQFGTPVAVLTDARFGTVIGTLAGTNPRQIQLALKISY
jgi:hypothetical protein